MQAFIKKIPLLEPFSKNITVAVILIVSNNWRNEFYNIIKSQYFLHR